VRDELKESERLKYEMDMRRRVAEKDWLATEKKLKKELSDVKKEKSMIQHRDNQYKVCALHCFSRTTQHRAMIINK
jgi:hypothetical protein